MRSMIPLLWTKYEEKKTACRLTLTFMQARVSTFAVEIFSPKVFFHRQNGRKNSKNNVDQVSSFMMISLHCGNQAMYT